VGLCTTNETNYDFDNQFHLEVVVQYKTLFSLLVVFAFGFVGCADKSSSDDSGAMDSEVESDADTGEPAEQESDCSAPDSFDGSEIPDPGTEYAPLRWYDDGGYHGTPATAQVMGILLDIPDYIQGGIDPATGKHYFVFRTFEDQTSFSVDLFDKTSEIEYVDIHDGTGLVFGEEIEPSSVTSAVTAEWELEGDTIYVMEVHSPIGGFF
jgi:hypothetical protein